MTILATKRFLVLLFSSIVITISKNKTFYCWDYEFCNFETSLVILSSIVSVIALMKRFMKEGRSNELAILTILSVILFCSLSFCSSNKFRFFLWFEISIVPIFVRIIMYRKDRSKIYSATIIVLINIAIAIPTVIFIFKDYSSALTLRTHVAAHSCLVLKRIVLIILVITIILRKAPMFFIHIWLPKAHVDSFTLGSVVLARLIIKLSIVGIVKFSQVIEEKLKEITWIIYRISWTTVVIALIIMIKRVDIKKLAATSSIVHIRATLNSCLSIKVFGAYRRFIVLLSHGIVSSIIFSAIGLMYENSEGRSTYANKRVERIDKLVMMTWTLILFLNVGLPPTITFFREVFLISNFMFMETYRILFLSIRIILIRNASMIRITKSLFYKSSIRSFYIKSVNCTFVRLIFLFTIWNLLIMKLF